MSGVNITVSLVRVFVNVMVSRVRVFGIRESGALHSGVPRHDASRRDLRRPPRDATLMPQRVVAGAHRRHSRRTRIHRVAIARVEFAPPMNARRREPESRVGTWCDKNIRVVPQRRERDVPRRRGAQTRRARRMRRARRSRSPTPVGSSDRLPALFYTRRGRCDATPRASARVDAR